MSKKDSSIEEREYSQGTKNFNFAIKKVCYFEIMHGCYMNRRYIECFFDRLSNLASNPKRQRFESVQLDCDLCL